MSDEYKSMSLRIRAASDVPALHKLSASLDRLFYAGIFSAREFGRLDTMIMERIAIMETAEK